METNAQQQYALYLLHTSTLPVDGIEWLIDNLTPEAKEQWKQEYDLLNGDGYFDEYKEV